MQNYNKNISIFFIISSDDTSLYFKSSHNRTCHRNHSLSLTLQSNRPSPAIKLSDMNVY